MNGITKYPARIGLLLLSIFIVLSVFFIFEYAKKERSRDLMDWQLRLNVLADMRVTSVEDWLSDRKNKLNELASNPTLRLYLSQYQQFDKEDISMQAQLSHVRNLLQATSIRFGFNKSNQNSKNTEQENKSKQGLAVLASDASILFSTRGINEDVERYLEAIEKSMASGQTIMIDMHKTNGNKLLYGFVMPVLHIQNNVISGAVIVLLDPEDNLFNKLINAHVNTKTDESLLIRKNLTSIEYLSPLQAGLGLMYKVSAHSMANAFEDTRGLIVLNDYKNDEVLSLMLSISNTDWFLLQKINSSEALQESDSHQQYLFTTFFLIVLFMTSLFVAVWRHSTSIRLLKLTNDLESRTTLLNAVSENINEHIFLVDDEQKFVFANDSLVKSLPVDSHEIYGKHMSSLLGVEVVRKIQSLDVSNRQSESVVNLLVGKEEKAYHVSCIDLATGQFKNSKLYVLHDISVIKEAQEKRDQLSRGIITTLVKAVDLHDPYCVDHSERTREVALDIAHELELEASRIEALEMAALLANIGKLFVPQKILTKMEPLTEDENLALRKNITYAVDILKELAFEGPVVEIISQKNESLDGSGYPAALKADEIMLESRILAVSNAFVAMASSRAYRKGKPIRDVINVLLEQQDIKYDRHIVAALFHISENKSNWGKWQEVIE